MADKLLEMNSLSAFFILTKFNSNQLIYFMLQHSISIKKKHQQFIKEVVANEIVWVLKSEEGYATSSSNDFEGLEDFESQVRAVLEKE